jgi:hypothetical protein
MAITTSSSIKVNAFRLSKMVPFLSQKWGWLLHSIVPAPRRQAGAHQKTGSAKISWVRVFACKLAACGPEWVRHTIAKDNEVHGKMRMS